MIVLGIAGGILLATPSYVLAFLGILCFHLMYLLDCVDGELARSAKKFTPVGEPLDHITHYITDTSLLMGTGIGLFFRSNQVVILFFMIGLVLSDLFHTTHSSNAILMRIKSPINPLPPVDSENCSVFYRE